MKISSSLFTQYKFKIRNNTNYTIFKCKHVNYVGKLSPQAITERRSIET